MIWNIISKKHKLFDKEFEAYAILREAEGTDGRLLVKSVKREIPHAGREGTWTHSTYYFIFDGEVIMECRSLKNAQAAAEAYWHDLEERRRI